MVVNYWLIPRTQGPFPGLEGNTCTVTVGKKGGDASGVATPGTLPPPAPTPLVGLTTLQILATPLGDAKKTVESEGRGSELEGEKGGR